MTTLTFSSQILLFLNPLYHNPKPCNPSLATTSLIEILTHTNFAKHTHIFVLKHTKFPQKPGLNTHTHGFAFFPTTKHSPCSKLLKVNPTHATKDRHLLRTQENKKVKRVPMTTNWRGFLSLTHWLISFKTCVQWCLNFVDILFLVYLVHFTCYIIFTFRVFF